jgi:trehalose 6-phosphate phosphatase
MYSAPVPQKCWALFLDLDGTLLDIAETPGEVTVPVGLLANLEQIEKWLGGALAIVSGRELAELQTLLAPLDLFLAAEHGAILHTPDCRLPRIVSARPVPQHLLDEIRSGCAQWPGVLVEIKSYGIAVHYRNALERRGNIEVLLSEVAGRDASYTIVPGRMVFELRHRDVNKGRAVDQLMQCPAFVDRVPVFVGDDVTDEDGIRQVEILGGLGLRVHEAFDGTPDNVRHWLKQFVG